jgi:hypothetical protein
MSKLVKAKLDGSYLARAVKMELARLSFLSEEEKKALGLEIKET